MQHRRETQGFTIFELMIVMAIMAVMLSFAVPSFNRYRQRENAKSDTLTIASALRAARARALKDGIPYILLLNPDVNGYTTAISPEFPDKGVTNPPERTVARLIRDDNGSQLEDAGDTFAMNVMLETGTYAGREYNPGTDGFTTADQPDALGGTLDDVDADGTTFPKLNGTSAVGFSNRGIPFDLNDNPPKPPSGTGGYYITDGLGSVFGVVLLPLGEVRVRTLSPAFDGWR
jgi:prepilin-type N-terminal cleavage/methylation domain-containing protein